MHVLFKLYNFIIKTFIYLNY